MNRFSTSRSLIASSVWSAIARRELAREDAAAIAREIATGFKDASRYVVCLNRAEAIRDAITLAGVGDAVLIAGKGHENYQEFGHTVIPFDDADVARRLLGKK